MFARRRNHLAALAVLGLAAAVSITNDRVAADPHGGGGPSPKVFDADSSPYGTSYGGWAAAWWQWALTFPPDNSPLFDETGEKAGLGQSGPVYFLAGAFAPGPHTRTITVPKGKALYFPILNFEWDNLFCLDPNTELTVLEMRALIAGHIDSATDMFCRVDNRPVRQIKKNFRVVTPAMNLVAVANSLCGDEPAGSSIPAVGDGYYVMLEPLSVGTHTVHFGGTLPDLGFSLDITYNITVTP